MENWQIEYEKLHKRVCGNPYQHAVVKWMAASAGTGSFQAARVLACAGSGKTTTIVDAVATLLNEGKIRPEDVVMVTFTNAGGSNMRSRMGKVVSREIAARIRHMGTFHSLGLQYLKTVDAGWKKAKILDTMEYEGKTHLWNLILGEPKRKEYTRADGSKYWADYEVPGVPGQLGLSADRGEISIPDYIKAVDLIRFRGFGLGSPEAKKTLAALQLAGYDKIAEAWGVYERSKLGTGNRDYLDMLWNYWKDGRDKARIVVVDECQDNSWLLLDVMRKLAVNAGGMLVFVGDVRQAIFGFAGAAPDVTMNADKVLGAVTLEIPTNYRSVDKVVQLGNAICYDRGEKADWALGTDAITARRVDPDTGLNVYGGGGVVPSGSIVVPTRFETTFDEALWVAKSIKEKLSKGTKPTDLAVLCRTNMGGAAYEVALLMHQIPVLRNLRGRGLFDHDAVGAALAYLHMADVIVGTVKWKERDEHQEVLLKILRYMGKSKVSPYNIARPTAKSRSGYNMADRWARGDLDVGSYLGWIVRGPYEDRESWWKHLWGDDYTDLGDIAAVLSESVTLAWKDKVAFIAKHVRSMAPKEAGEEQTIRVVTRGEEEVEGAGTRELRAGVVAGDDGQALVATAMAAAEEEGGTDAMTAFEGIAEQFDSLASLTEFLSQMTNNGQSTIEVDAIDLEDFTSPGFRLGRKEFGEFYATFLTKEAMKWGKKRVEPDWERIYGGWDAQARRKIVGLYDIHVERGTLPERGWERLQERRKDLAQRVMLSTVHRAKGLEWSHVYVSVSYKQFPNARVVEGTEQYEEDRRVLYVACTRAIDCLTITRNAERVGPNDETSTSPLFTDYIAPFLRGERQRDAVADFAKLAGAATGEGWVLMFCRTAGAPVEEPRWAEWRHATGEAVPAVAVMANQAGGMDVLVRRAAGTDMLTVQSGTEAVELAAMAMADDKGPRASGKVEVELDAFLDWLNEQETVGKIPGKALAGYIQKHRAEVQAHLQQIALDSGVDLPLARLWGRMGKPPEGCNGFALSWGDGALAGGLWPSQGVLRFVGNPAVLLEPDMTITPASIMEQIGAGGSEMAIYIGHAKTVFPAVVYTDGSPMLTHAMEIAATMSVVREKPSEPPVPLEPPEPQAPPVSVKPTQKPARKPVQPPRFPYPSQVESTPWQGSEHPTVTVWNDESGAACDIVLGEDDKKERYRERLASGLRGGSRLPVQSAYDMHIRVELRKLDKLLWEVHDILDGSFLAEDLIRTKGFRVSVDEALSAWVSSVTSDLYPDEVARLPVGIGAMYDMTGEEQRTYQDWLDGEGDFEGDQPVPYELSTFLNGVTKLFPVVGDGARGEGVRDGLYEHLGVAGGPGPYASTEREPDDDSAKLESMILLSALRYVVTAPWFTGFYMMAIQSYRKGYERLVGDLTGKLVMPRLVDVLRRRSAPDPGTGLGGGHLASLFPTEMVTTYTLRLPPWCYTRADFLQGVSQMVIGSSPKDGDEGLDEVPAAIRDMAAVVLARMRNDDSADQGMATSRYERALALAALCDHRKQVAQAVDDGQAVPRAVRAEYDLGPGFYMAPAAKLFTRFYPVEWDADAQRVGHVGTGFVDMADAKIEQEDEENLNIVLKIPEQEVGAALRSDAPGNVREIDETAQVKMKGTVIMQAMSQAPAVLSTDAVAKWLAAAQARTGGRLKLTPSQIMRAAQRALAATPDSGLFAILLVKDLAGDVHITWKVPDWEGEIDRQAFLSSLVGPACYARNRDDYVLGMWTYKASHLDEGVEPSQSSPDAPAPEPVSLPTTMSGWPAIPRAVVLPPPPAGESRALVLGLSNVAQGIDSLSLPLPTDGPSKVLIGSYILGRAVKRGKGKKKKGPEPKELSLSRVGPDGTLAPVLNVTAQDEEGEYAFSQAATNAVREGFQVYEPIPPGLMSRAVSDPLRIALREVYMASAGDPLWREADGRITVRDVGLAMTRTFPTPTTGIVRLSGAETARVTFPSTGIVRLSFVDVVRAKILKPGRQDADGAAQFVWE